MPKVTTSPEALQKLIQLYQQSPILEGMKPEDIAAFAERATIKSYLHGEDILKQCDPPTGFFFIIQGQVRITHDPNQKCEEPPAVEELFEEEPETPPAEPKTPPAEPRVINFMGKGEFLGEYALRRMARREKKTNGVDPYKRYATATVIVDAVVAEYTLADWAWLHNIFPACEEGFEQQEEAYKTHQEVTRKISKTFDDIQPDEIGILNIDRHPLVFFAGLAAPLGLLLVGIILGALIGDVHFGRTIPLGKFIIYLFGLISFLWGIYEFAEWKNDDFIVSSQRVIHIERYVVGGEHRETVPLVQVLAAEVSTPTYFTRIFDFDNVFIKTAGVGHVIFDGIQNGEHIRRIILNEREKALERSQAADLDAISKAVQKKVIEQQVEILPLEEEKKEEVAKHSILDDLRALVGFYLPRIVHEAPDGTITWRRHPIIWLREIWKPAITLLGTTYLILAALVGLMPFTASHSKIGIVLFIFWVIVLGWYTYQHDNWRKISYQVTKSKIIRRNKPVIQLLGEDTNETTFDNVQNINFEIPGFIARLLRLGHVEIKTASVGDPFVFRNVYFPRDVQQKVFNYWVQYREDKAQKERDAEEDRFSKWLAEYHRNANQP